METSKIGYNATIILDDDSYFLADAGELSDEAFLYWLASFCPLLADEDKDPSLYTSSSARMHAIAQASNLIKHVGLQLKRATGLKMEDMQLK